MSVELITVPCNLCGRDDFTVRYPASFANGTALTVDAVRCTNPGYGEHAQIVQCNNCAYVYANPRWSMETIISAYEDVEDETYVEEREGRELTFSKHLHDFERIVGQANGRTLLDVGAYIGVFVDVATKSGWQAMGVEPSVWGAEQATANGLNVIQGTMENRELAGKAFDVVTLWDVIEHVDDPNAEIAKAFELLKPGGYVALHTMDVDSLFAKVMGSRWPWYMEMHLHFFSQKSLGQMLEQNGFVVVESKAKGRYLRLGYVATRIGGIHKGIGRFAHTLITKLGLANVAIPINFGDLFTIVAQKPVK